MIAQAYNWTCSVCSITWCLQSTHTIDPYKDVYDARYDVGSIMGYPNCVNPTYGCMSSDCVADTFASFGYITKRITTTFDGAYAICREFTGTINPQGMYHFMGIRGVIDNDIWVANSAQGYRGVYDRLSRSQYNNLGPVEVIYLESHSA